MMRRRLMVLLGMLAVAGLVIGIVVSTGTRGAPHANVKSTSGKWLHPVLTALRVTTGASSYAFTYTTTFQPGSEPGETPSVTSGHGVVNLNPYAMITTNSPESSFPNVTAEFDSTRVWEFGAGDYGTGNPPTASPGDSLSGFAGSVEGSLGQGQGALAMVSLASPTGRLNLDPSMMTNVQPVGTGSVDAVSVTNYRVSIDLSSELDQPTLSEEQRTTISQALAILSRQGYSGTTEIVSVDGLGFIRETKTMATFADGGSVSSDNMISDIGCAGTVTPGDPVPTPAPPGCVSPDQPGVEPAAPTTTTTSTTNTTSTTTPTTEAPTVARCVNGQISVTNAGGGSGLGHQDQVILFTNQSRSTCSLTGFPGVAGLDAEGNQVVQAQRTPGGYLGGLPPGVTVPPMVPLMPGQTASAVIEGTDMPVGSATTCPHYPALLVTPPGLSDSVRVSVSDLGTNPPGLPGCSPIEVHPVVPGSSGSTE
jgi:hypothetical protein